MSDKCTCMFCGFRLNDLRSHLAACHVGINNRGPCFCGANLDKSTMAYHLAEHHDCKLHIALVAAGAGDHFNERK